ncbi:hypothetical protein GPX89_37125 [Nocardia sp. ET3-3]|uniref:Uncharacterized protein n=1 Tax=Nocardia terrae TaxID=2675851 RepID=A0A7K1V867_9NOCA|nr:hypothetical protein [Nocardia terrae]MVU82845.1 hypothetical protein [Nocardia terrae]
MRRTDPTNDFRVLHEALGYDTEQLLAFTLAAVEGCWLDETDKAERMSVRAG